MSVSGVLSKGCVPELSLVGSRVAMLEPLAYRHPSAQSHHSATSIEPSLAVLPRISHVTASHPHSNQVTNTRHVLTSGRSRITSAQSYVGKLQGQAGNTVLQVHNDILNTSADRGQCWTSDADIISQAIALEQFNLAHIPLGDTKPRDKCVKRSGCEKRHTWHEELQRESSENMSQPDIQSTVVQLDTQPSTPLSVEVTTWNKRRKKRKKKKKSAKVHINKFGEIRIRTNSARRSFTVIPSHNGKQQSYDNSIMVAQCKAIKVLPSPPKATKPKLVEAYLTQNSKKSMGGAASTTTVINSNKRCGELFAQKCVDTVVHRVVRSNSEPPSRLIKVFCSDKQSGMVRILGQELPCAPPTTPMPEMLERFEYVPSMMDIRSQRSVKVRLEALNKVEKKKQEKLQEEKHKKEKEEMKTKEKDVKKRQRQEIYALNKLMTEFENGNFMEFCRKNGVVISSKS